jgi:hypothetical protein
MYGQDLVPGALPLTNGACLCYTEYNKSIGKRSDSSVVLNFVPLCMKLMMKLSQAIDIGPL